MKVKIKTAYPGLQVYKKNESIKIRRLRKFSWKTN